LTCEAAWRAGVRKGWLRRSPSGLCHPCWVRFCLGPIDVIQGLVSGSGGGVGMDLSQEAGMDRAGEGAAAAAGMVLLTLASAHS